jgi:hypothetical protein
MSRQMRLPIAILLLSMTPCRSAYAQSAPGGACNSRISFTIPEGGTRRIDLPNGYLSVFAEEIKGPGDDSHFYVVRSDRPLALVTESLEKREFERRLRTDKVAKASNRRLDYRAYAVIDVRPLRPQSLQIPEATIQLLVANPRRHVGADVSICQ